MALVGHPSFAPYKTQSLQTVLFGGTIISPELLTATIAKIGATKAVAVYGMSEGLPICGSAAGRGYLNGDNSGFYDDDHGHWFATGDQAKIDEKGSIYLLGRYKVIIIRGAENQSPALIENCLNKAGVVVSSAHQACPRSMADEENRLKLLGFPIRWLARFYILSFNL